MFPGQGAQTVGMCSTICDEVPKAKIRDYGEYYGLISRDDGCLYLKCGDGTEMPIMEVDARNF